MTSKIKTATACYTGGGIYIYYGQLENGLYFRACDDFDVIYICDADTSNEEAEYGEFYEKHTVKELIGEEFKGFWNQTIEHILCNGAPFDEWNNYSSNDLERRFIK